MLRFVPALALLTLSGCEFFEKAGETLDGLTNPLVGLGLVLGVEEPEEADLEGTGFEAGTTFSLFLADAANVTDLDNAPVNGAVVSLQDVEADDSQDGLYLISPDVGPTYVDGASWTVDIQLGTDVATASLTLPEAPEFAPDLIHTAETALTLDLSGQGYEGVIIVVMESSTGDLTYTTEPQTAREVYDLTRGNTEVTEVEIPGTAFPSEDELYLVGIAGLNHANGSDVDGMNTALSSVSAGKMVFEPVSTATTPIE